MAFVLKGTGIHFCGVDEEAIGPGTVIFVPPGVAHGYRALRDVEVYNCFFRSELADFELLWAARDDGLVTLFGRASASRRGDGDGHVVSQLDPAGFDECIAELDSIRNQESGERSHAREIGHLLLALDVVARHGQRLVPTAPARRRAMPRVVEAALGAFDDDLARRWTLGDLSNEVFVGSFHLAHEFKRWVGVSPMAYLAQRRAERAGILLAASDESIAAIGRAVGWPEPPAFSRQFSKAYGVSPREFRRRRAELHAEDLPD
jgi:AraC-like DNA-binding protein